ncbi:MAG: serine/threonine protein kinase [Planctomycetia bacterium]|nr:serine/threonine protein kinase [Planctomycetia bacterium]
MPLLLCRTSHLPRSSGATSRGSMQFEQLGPYRIGKQLGRGGMGTVYAAVNVQLNTPAAVKVLAPQLAMQSGFRERFEAEIESLKKLHHPNIVQLFGYGQQDDVLFYAMELVEGVSLEDELTRGRRFEWREVSNLCIKLCRALKLAHDHGIVHRDIKPANLILTQDEDVKLTDFGIARLFGNTGLTSEGGVLGTAEYMAPEQADGRRVTHHCDLYSLGGVMYALLAGRPPFRSDSLLEMLQLQRYATPEPVRRFAPETPVEFEQIIAQLLAKDPQQRFPNALILARRLEAMQRGLSIRKDPDAPGEGAPPPKLPRRGSYKATLDGGDSSGQLGSTRGAATGAAAGGATSNFDLTGSTGGESVAPLSSATVPAPPSTRFTTVEEDAVRESELRSSQREPLISLATMLLVVGLAAIAGVVWFSLQPESADSMYRRIDAAASSNDDHKLVDAKDDIARFLSLYSNDPRAEEMRGYQSRITTMQLEGTALVQARLLSRRHPRSALGREYLEAIKLAEISPDRAAVRLQAIVDLYGDGNRQAPGIRDFVEAARQQIPAMKQRVTDLTSVRRSLIEDRLRQADKVSQSDPDQARRIRQAIVDLYHDEPWAAPLVARARATLAVQIPESNEQ